MPPFQGLPSSRPPNPRALPWAVLLCPFRAKSRTRTRKMSPVYATSIIPAQSVTHPVQPSHLSLRLGPRKGDSTGGGLWPDREASGGRLPWSAMTHARAKLGIRWVGYVVMPERVHLLLFPMPIGADAPVGVSTVLHDLKQTVGDDTGKKHSA